MSDQTSPVGASESPHDERRGEFARAGSGRARLDPSSEWFWPAINLVGLVVVVVVNALANIVELNDLSTGDVVNRDPIHFQPAGWTFSIWSLIYLLLAVFVVYSFLPRGRRDIRMSRIGLLFLIANIANVTWLFLWHYEQWLPSTIVMVVLLVSLALLHTGLRRTRRNRPPDAMERLMLWTPFSVYLGWIVVAFIANVSVWRDREDIGVPDIGGRWWAVLMIVVVILVTALMALWRHDPAFSLVVVWALTGIVVQQWDRSMLVAIAAILGVIAAAVLTVVASLISYERHTVATALPQSVPPKHRSEVLTRGRRPTDS